MKPLPALSLFAAAWLTTAQAMAADAATNPLSNPGLLTDATGASRLLLVGAVAMLGVLAYVITRAAKARRNRPQHQRPGPQWTHEPMQVDSRGFKLSAFDDLDPTASTMGTETLPDATVVQPHTPRKLRKRARVPTPPRHALDRHTLA